MEDNILGEADFLWQYILGQTRYLRDQVERALEVILCGKVSETSRSARHERNISHTDLERYARLWATALPDSPEIKAALAKRMATQYALFRSEMPETWQALELDSETVATAYQRMYGQSMARLFSAAPPPRQPLPTPPVAPGAERDWRGDGNRPRPQ